MLLVDVGTNAEIVLGNRDRVVAASSPTGPAFEGAEISAGQRAAPGAIERVRIDPGDARAAIPGDRRRQWSDEPGFAEAASAVGVTGICGSGIIEVVAEMYLAGIIPRTACSTAASRRAAPASPATAAPSPTCSTTASSASPSPRTTCAPSSSPRRRSMPASSC